MDYGALALIPPLVVIILAIWLRTSFEPLLIGCIAGFLILERENFFTGFVDALYRVMQDESTVWVILVCGLYGSLIGLMVRSGGALKFGDDMLKRIKSRRAALFGTWGLGIFIFLDDYLSALTVGITMKKITDHFRIPRELLAYIVNTTAAPLSVIVPISTWTLFIGSILIKSKFGGEVTANHAYWQVIPYVAYSWVSIFMIPLVILGIVPLFGKMKKANGRAIDFGQIIPPGKKMAAVKLELFENEKDPKTLYFILPLIVLLVSTVLLDYDALKGVMIAVAFTFVYYLVMKLGSFQQLSETLFAGFNSMLYALALVVMSYVLKDVGDQLGLTQYVIDSVKPLVNKELLPVLVFIAISFISFTTGSSWGVYAVAIPIIIPLAISLDSNPLINIGAVISAGVFGANACLYSDATILTSQSTDMNNLDHALSQLPYALIAFGITVLIYLGFGYLS